MKKKTWVVLTICCSLALGGVALASLNTNQVNANSPSLTEKTSYATESYEAQKKIADAPGATTEDEQKLKELATKAADLEAELHPKSELEEFNEVFEGYNDLFAIESAYYADQHDLEDPAVQRVLYELEQKGKLIAQFENLQLKAQSEDANLIKTLNGQSLLDKFLEETQQLNQELYPDQDSSD